MELCIENFAQPMDLRKEISEAFDVHDNSDDHQTDSDRFFTDDEDQYEVDEDEFGCSYDSELESALEITGDWGFIVPRYP